MRIHLNLSRNTSPVNFNYQEALTGAFHKWLGRNEEHGKMSLYSFSWLQGGRKAGNNLYFPQGGSFFISAYDNELIKKLIDGIQTDPFTCYGMEVTEIRLQPTPRFGKEEHFMLASPVLVKRNDGEKDVHYTYKNPEANQYMTETLQRKLKHAELEEEHIELSFDTNYPRPTTKLVEYQGISNRATMCPVIIRGTEKAIAFAWEVGIGNSTGIGFGALR